MNVDLVDLARSRDRISESPTVDPVPPNAHVHVDDSGSYQLELS